jgi:hypothetical protein
MFAEEQHANIKYCVLLHKSPSKTLSVLEEAYTKAVMKETQVYGWHEHGRVSVDDRPQGATAGGPYSVPCLHTGCW